MDSPYSLQHVGNTESDLLLNSSQSTGTVQNIHSEISCPQPAHNCRSRDRSTSHSVVSVDKEIREDEHVPTSSRQVALKTQYLQSTSQIHNTERLSFYPAVSGVDKHQPSRHHYDSISSTKELNPNTAVHQQLQSSATECSSRNTDCVGTGVERTLVLKSKTIGTVTEPLTCLNCGCRQSLVKLGQCFSQQLQQSQNHVAAQPACFLESAAKYDAQFDNGIKAFHLGCRSASRNTDCGNMADVASAPSSDDACVNLDIVCKSFLYGNVMIPNYTTVQGCCNIRMSFWCLEEQKCFMLIIAHCSGTPV